MKRSFNHGARLLAVGVAFVITSGGVLVHAGDGDRSGFVAEEWLNGPQGLVEGIAAAETEGRVLMVYFYADWCGYCRQFEKELLGTPAFRAFVQQNVAVRIDPGKGESERRLASFYGVRGYPTFFVYGSRSKGLIPVDRHDFSGGKPELLSPQRFIARITEASAR